jgi:hypothetical protein
MYDPCMAPPKRTKHKSRGITTGLGICSYFATLFQANELAPKGRKMTDEQIAMKVEHEFPNRPGAFAYRGQTKKRTINEYRHRYNTGKFTGGILPLLFSFRYNSSGEIVDGKTGKEVLPVIQIDGFKSAHRYWRGLQQKELETLYGAG